MLRVVVLPSLVFMTALALYQLPEYMKLCSRDDPNLNECIRKNLQELFPRFCKGEPIFELPPLDPFQFYLGVIEVRQWNLYGSTTVKNSTAIGNRDIRFHEVRANVSDPRKLEMDIDFFHPSLFIEGEYDSVGKVIIFNVNGSGNYNVTMKNINSTWYLRGELTNGDDGEEYMRINRFGVKANIGSLQFYASDLFNGNKQINKAILRFVNRSWRMLYNRLSPVIDESFNSSMLHLANTVFLKVPYNQLFPLSNKHEGTTPNSRFEINATRTTADTNTEITLTEATEIPAETTTVETMDISGETTTPDDPMDVTAETKSAASADTYAETATTAGATDIYAETKPEETTVTLAQTIKSADEMDIFVETATNDVTTNTSIQNAI